jgi:hypothetical protein
MLDQRSRSSLCKLGLRVSGFRVLQSGKISCLFYRFLIPEICSRQINGPRISSIQRSRSHRDFGFQRFSRTNARFSRCANYELTDPTIKVGPDRSLDLRSRSHRDFRFQRFSRTNARLSRRTNSELIDLTIKVGPDRSLDLRSKSHRDFGFWTSEDSSPSR